MQALVYEWANSLAKWTNSYKGGDGLDELVVGDFLQVDADSKPKYLCETKFWLRNFKKFETS